MSTQSLTVKIGLTGLSSVTAGLRSVSASATAAVSGLTRLAAPVAALVGSVAGVAAVSAGFKGILDQGGKVSDFAARTGLAASSIIRWGQVFQDSGLSADQVGAVFDKVAKSIYDTATAGGEGERAMLRLGLSAKVLASQTREAQFEALGNALNGIVNPTERTAVAMQILGRSGGEVLVAFDSMRDLAGTDKVLGRLPEILGRNAVLFDGISDSIGHASVKSQQFFAGLADQVAPSLRELVSAATAIDLTDAGQTVGAFVNVAVEEWKAGRFGELVALTIEAGFEQGENAARRAFRGLGDFLSSSSLWVGVGVGLLTAVNESLKLVGSGAIWLTDLIANALLDSVAPFELAFTVVFNSIGEKLNGLMNQLLKLADKLPPELNPLSGVASFDFQPLPGNLTSGARGLVGRETEAARGRLNGFFDRSTEAARDLAGFSQGSGDNFAASEKLGSLIDEMKKRREETAATEKQVSSTLSAQIPIVNTLAAIRDREAETVRKLRQLDDERARVQGSFAITEAQKFQTNLSLLQAQREELERMVALLREQAALPGLTDSDRTQISSRADSFDQRLSGVKREFAGVGPNPESTPEQMTAAINELQDQFGTVAQGIARSFKTVIGTAVDSVSGGLQRLIGDTEYWSSRLGNIAGPIMGAVTASITRMFTEWIVQRGLAAAKNIAASFMEGSADATAKAPGALMASISSFGIAAGVGVAAFLAATALTGGFREGGYTGGGGLNDIAGVVHGREFVMNAATVERVGVPQLQAIQDGAQPAAAPASGGGSVNIATFDSRMDARRWAESVEGETWFVDMARRTAHKTR